MLPLWTAALKPFSRLSFVEQSLKTLVLSQAVEGGALREVQEPAAPSFHGDSQPGKGAFEVAERRFGLGDQHRLVGVRR